MRARMLARLLAARGALLGGGHSRGCANSSSCCCSSSRGSQPGLEQRALLQVHTPTFTRTHTRTRTRTHAGSAANSAVAQQVSNKGVLFARIPMQFARIPMAGCSLRCAQGLSPALTPIARSPCSQAAGAEASSSPQQAFNAPSLRVRRGVEKGVCRCCCARRRSGHRMHGPLPRPADALRARLPSGVMSPGVQAPRPTTRSFDASGSCSSGASTCKPIQ